MRCFDGFLLRYAAAICLLLTAGAALPAVELDAPTPLDAFLRRHLVLPETLPDATAHAALIGRTRIEIADLLATEGYFSPRIDLHPEADGLRIAVTPGRRTTVATVEIGFRGHLATADQAARRAALRAAWPLPAGAAFRAPDWEAAKQALLAATAATDYAAARLVASRAEVDPEAAAAHLELTLDSGPAARFGPLTVEGLKRYDQTLVAGLAPFKPGEPYQRTALLDFQSRLQNTPWFHSVAVEAAPGTPSADGVTDVPVRVTLAETPAKRIGLGAGVSTNTGARGEANFRHHDFLGRAWDFDTGLRLEQKRQTLFASLGLLPDARGYRLGFGGRVESSDIQGLATFRQVLGATRSRTEGRIETRLGLEWQREERRPDGVPAATDHALTLDWHWIRRAVDDLLDPRRGNVVELRIGGATRHLLSDRDFLRTQLRVQQWWPVAWLGPRDVFSLRGEAGYTAAGSRFGIPQDYLFRAGGAQSVRGHAYQSLGVREGSAVVGGRALASASAEYTHWLPSGEGAAGPWGIAAFVDAGDAADDWRALDPAVGIGAGVRWKSPAGPLALDLARGLAHGGRAAQWQLHFSLMVAF
ncbi:MAG: BamA/TamA family outer membrane protein [Rhodocyclaceae bacterium]|nr:BamA/TamA family outer membrane protein [Rhodocyclaceae bacterium]MDZ4215403.1 BamA/TamA family outer membrane protein [Rhodocyclaceae bacterium]